MILVLNSIWHENWERGLLSWCPCVGGAPASAFSRLFQPLRELSANKMFAALTFLRSCFWPRSGRKTRIAGFTGSPMWPPMSCSRSSSETLDVGRGNPLMGRSSNHDMTATRGSVSEVDTQRIEPPKAFAERKRWGTQESILGSSLPEDQLPNNLHRMDRFRIPGTQPVSESASEVDVRLGARHVLPPSGSRPGLSVVLGLMAVAALFSAGVWWGMPSS